MGDLLPRLTPILKNRHEKVQENCIDLVGRIADRGPEYVSAREWMRICFELLGLLKAHKKAIRRATVNTFGYIAKAIGPHDVLATLLNNLKVQERQNRVCTTVAIAIVAETCSPFTVLPGLMNEYRVPELNVQNGVLKSLSFLFEYFGDFPSLSPSLHGCCRWHESLPWTRQSLILCFAGSIPSCKKSKGCLLENLQYHVHWIARCPRSRLFQNSQ